MHFVRIYADESGESHFEDVNATITPTDFAPPAPPVGLAPPEVADRVMMMSIPQGWAGDWHPTPRRQYFVMGTGHLDVVVSDGEERRFGPGDIVLLEDTSGKGHVTKVHGEGVVTGMFVQLSDSA